ncbi:o-succinylbenzoate--CoA ligase [Effusibacillus pohliae]|uniref:o-succinylbenzoate--CoA ligase n=1 Tax=Effusibacillus pohliae TaxID=232270 RepID=UPI00036C70A2|nr:o-succinylbenzoate--CoA ligase [Effusibacillus pohliae]
MRGVAYWIEKRAFITPHRMALIGEHRRLTYFQVALEMEHIVRFLQQSCGLQRGERVAILSDNSVEYLELLFALAKMGCIAVPLNTRLASAELEFQLQDSGTSVLVVSEAYRETGKRLNANCRLRHLVSVSELLEQSPVRRIPPTDHFAYAPLCESTTVSGDSPFVICYTSGTTGRPKGAVLTQDNMFWNALNNILGLDLSSEDRVLTLLPLFHIGGIGLFAFPALLAGGTVAVPGRFDPDRALRWIEREKITVVMGVPTMFDALRKCKRFRETDFRSIRWLYSGGAPCPRELISFYLERGIPFGQGYGMTETSPTVFLLTKDDYRRKAGSIGKPALFCEVRVVDDDGRDVPRGTVGELVVKGPNVLREYWNLPEGAAAGFCDGWFRTGDLARMDEEGFVYMAGRKKDMIISGGENVYPLEVEQAIGEHPAVAEAAVIGVPDEKWGEVPMAIVALHAGATLAEQELIGHCAGRLAKYKCPKIVKYVNALPKNATGKIDKAALRQQYAKEAAGLPLREGETP